LKLAELYSSGVIDDKGNVINSEAFASQSVISVEPPTVPNESKKMPRQYLEDS
jgi:hypothetical protein